MYVGALPICIKLGNRTFRQIIEIPVGSDPAQFFANLSLHYYESRGIRQLRISDIRRARRFAVFRFIDDLTAINDRVNSKGVIEKENIDYSEGSFLDFNMKIEHHKSNIQLFDKRDDFAFAIVRMSHLTSNIPSKIFYSAFIGKILPTAPTTSICETFSKSF